MQESRCSCIRELIMCIQRSAFTPVFLSGVERLYQNSCGQPRRNSTGLPCGVWR
jgi:hypothetical protein